MVVEKNKMMGETKLVGFGEKVLDDNEVVLVFLLFTLARIQTSQGWENWQYVQLYILFLLVFFVQDHKLEGGFKFRDPVFI